MSQKVRKRNSSTIPVGYREHPENSSLLIEHEDEQKALVEIREMRESQSLRKLIDLLQAHTGRVVTPRGMQKILDRAY
jgi:hypothetical protein